jgi:predicted dehydrogenase
MKKIGLIGLGNMGKNHLRVLSILNNVEISFIYDFDSNKSNKYAKEFSTISLDKFDLDIISKVDAVILATPTSTHFEYLKLLIGVVANIFVEKPVTNTFEEAYEISKLLKLNKTFIQVGFIERFNPAVTIIKGIINEERVFCIDFFRTNKLSSRITDVDVISDLMIHDIDLAMFLNGEIIEISAYGFVNSNLIDYATVLFKHKNGAISRLEASRITECKKRAIYITTEDMFINCDLLRKEVQVSKQSITKQYIDKPYKIISSEEKIEVLPQESLLLEIQDFIKNITNSDLVSAISPVFKDGYNATEICDKIKLLINDSKSATLKLN